MATGVVRATPPTVTTKLFREALRGNFVAFGVAVTISAIGNPIARIRGAITDNYTNPFTGEYLDSPRKIQDATFNTILLLGGPLTEAGSALRTVANPVPRELARVIAGIGNFPTLGPPSRTDVFVTAAEDIAGLNAKQIAERLTIPEADNFVVLRFATPESGLATPVNRPDPGFIGGGRTAGGAREFVIPNGPVPAGARREVIGP